MKREHVAVTIIPALPGFSVVQPERDADQAGSPIVGLYRVPVIGWRVETCRRPHDGSVYDCASPITPDDLDAEKATYAIEYPNGEKTLPYDRDFPAGADGEAALIAYWQQQTNAKTGGQRA